MDNYFGYFDKSSVKRNYDWFALNINLNFNKKDIDLDNVLTNISSFGDTRNEVIFIHEYVHFIQNFNTPFGVTQLCEFTHGLFQIGASRVTDNIVLKLPLKIEAIKGANMWNRGVSNIRKVEKTLGISEEGWTYVSPMNYPFYKVSKKTILAINNGRINFQLGNTTIREHMAHLASMLFNRMDDDAVHDDYLKRSEFIATPGMLEKSPEYWIIFEYFYNKKYTEVAEGVVLLCTECLTRLNPLTGLRRFFDFIGNAKYNKNTDLLQLVNLWRQDEGEVTARKVAKEKTLKILEEKIALCEKHKMAHDFCKFTIVIFNALRSNLQNYDKFIVDFEAPLRLRNK